MVPGYCKAALSCCPGKIDDLGGDLEGCIAKFAQNCFLNLFDEVAGFVEEGKSVLNQQELTACRTSYDDQAQNCERPLLAVAFGCLTALEGTTPVGGACPDGNVDSSTAYCADGYCKDNMCIALLGDGESCAEEGICNSPGGSTCLEDNVCGPAKEIGESCTNGTQCSSWSCDANTGLCVAPTTNALCGSIN